MSKMESSGWGGKRPGSGRKKGSKSKKKMDERCRRIQYQVRLPRYIVEWLRDQPESAGRIIENALRSTHDFGD